MHVVPVTNPAIDVAVEVIEPARVGQVGALPTAQVPLARHEGLVACALEILGQQRLADRQAGRRKFRQGLGDAQAHRRASRQEGGPRWAASGLRVKAIQIDALSCERIDVRRADFTAVIADIAPTHVVGDDDDDIGS